MSCFIRPEQLVEDDFSVVLDYDEIATKNYSFSAGQYFDVKMEYVDITHEDFELKMQEFSSNLDVMFAESHDLEVKIKEQLLGLKYV